MFVWVESPGENALGLLDPLCMLPEEEQDHSPSLARVFQEAIMDDLQWNLFFTRLNMIMDTQAFGLPRETNELNELTVHDRRKVESLCATLNVLGTLPSIPDIMSTLEDWELLPNVLRLVDNVRDYPLPFVFHRAAVCFVWHVTNPARLARPRAGPLSCRESPSKRRQNGTPR